MILILLFKKPKTTIEQFNKNYINNCSLLQKKYNNHCIKNKNMLL